MTTATRAMLAVLTVAVVVIAAALVYVTFFRGEDDPERDRARDYFRTQAIGPCSRLPNDEFRDCIDRAVDLMLRDWDESGRPAPSTIPTPMNP